MTENEFVLELEKINIVINDKQLKQLDKYYNLLVEWNKVMNLTGITEKKDVYLKHFYDSLTIFKAIDLNNYHTLCDIGTGAGFPGLVIKILFPHLNITLVDSLNKRINFLNEVIDKLSLENIIAIHSRVEEYQLKNHFDIVTCRAVSHLRTILEYSIPLVKVNGYFVPLKATLTNELEESKNAMNKLFCKLENVIEFDLPFEKSIRNILVIKKEKHNKLFPRKYSEIIKKPL